MLLNCVTFFLTPLKYRINALLYLHHMDLLEEELPLLVLEPDLLPQLLHLVLLLLLLQ
jgi:hypothetical protein